MKHKKPLEPLVDEAMEARIVAWILGEASAFEASELEQRCAEEPELGLFEKRMREVHSLIGANGKNQTDEKWQLPEPKRRKVVDLLGVTAEVEVKRKWSVRRVFPRQVVMAMAACILASLIALPLLIEQGGAPALMKAETIAYYSVASSPAEERNFNLRAKHSLEKEAELPQRGSRMAAASEVEPLKRNRERSLGENIISGPMGGGRVSERNSGSTVSREPSAPSSSMAAVVVPVLEKDGLEVPPAVDFGNGGDFGGGWDEKPMAKDVSVDAVPMLGDLPQIARLFNRGEISKGEKELEQNTPFEGSVHLGSRIEGIEHDRDRPVKLDSTKALDSDGIVFSDPDPNEDGDGFGLSMGGEDPFVARNLPANLDDSIRSNPSLTDEHSGKIDKLRRGLYKAQGHYDLGSFDKAEREYEDVLRIDKYNSAARRGLERVAATKAGYYTAAYDQTRSELLAEVDSAWKMKEQPPAAAPKKPTPEIADLENRQIELNMVGRLPAISGKMIDEINGVTDGRGIRRELAAFPDDAITSVMGGFKLDLMTELSDGDRVDSARDKLIDEVDAAWEMAESSVDGKLQRPAAPLPLQGELESDGSMLGASSGQSINLGRKRLNEVKKEMADLSGSVRLGLERPGGQGLVAGKKRKDQIASAEASQLQRSEKKENGKVELAHLDDPVRNSPALNDEPTEDSERIRRNLYKAQGYFDLGRFDEATKEYQKVLRIDGFNKDARRGMEVVTAAKSDYYTAAYDEIRVELVEEVSAEDEPYSTFSLHVSDASFKLASAAIQRGEVPAAESVRPEEFYNAFDYGDPTPKLGEPVACVVEQCAHPAFPQRNLLRIAVRTGSAGRAQSMPLNLTLLLDNSGSMEREDRALGLKNAVAGLSSLLKAGDTVTVAGFSRRSRLLADRLDGEFAEQLNDLVGEVPAEGGTNLEQALELGGDLAKRQWIEGAQNRVVLFTDGAANLGDADPESLNRKVEELRQNGIAFDAAGFGAEGLNDRMLERLTRNGNGRYYVVDNPEDANAGFAEQLAGAFRPAAENVKVQVVFNPSRVGRYKLIGFEEHRLNKEDFRNDAVDAAEMASEEAGVALYQFEVLPEGQGEVGEVSVRFRDMSSGEMVERTWTIPYDPQSAGFDQAKPSIQLAGLSAFVAEKLRSAPMAEAVDLRQMAGVMARVKAAYKGSAKVAQLEEMIDKTAQ